MIDSKKANKNILVSFLLALSILTLTAMRPLSGQSAEEGMERISASFFRHASPDEINRRVSYRPEDWPAHVIHLVKIEKDGLPLLGRPDLTADRLDVIGVTKGDEILQFIDQTKIISFDNPLSSGPGNSGLWYKVRTLKGDEGWILVQPDNQGSISATLLPARAITTPESKTYAENRKPRADETDGTIRSIIYALIILGVFLLFIRIAHSHTSDQSSSSSSGTYEYSSGPSSAGSEGQIAASRAEEGKKDESSWPFRGANYKITKTGVKETSSILPDRKVGTIKENIVKDEIVYESTLLGHKEVGRIQRNWLESKVVDSSGNVVLTEKTTIGGRRVWVDRDGNEHGEVKK
jgi:hypothetical protein